MWIQVLGAAAGGGFPQWNCNCSNCSRLRRGEITATARSQSSIAVSGDRRSWALINASPDIRTQLEATPALQPRDNVRATPIAGIVLIDSQIDHTTGLLTLREGDPLEIYCTEPVHSDLTTTHPILSSLKHYCGFHWHQVSLGGAPFSVAGVDGLGFTAVPVQSNAPPYSHRRDKPIPGDNIGLHIKDEQTGKSLFYAPGLGGLNDVIREIMAGSDCLLVDGTCWRDDELVVAGIADKRARDMGHLPQSGKGGMLEVLWGMDRPRKILIHINNTNPILDEESPERAELDRAGIEVAYDGMEILL
jgi:pyrroloquinoline quinone biosynthesis protein B